jgi:hypothetical protein
VSDPDTERRSIPGPRAATPKGAALNQSAQNFDTKPEIPAEGKRPVGRPPKADPFTVLRVVAVELKSLDKDARRQVLETLLALSE